MTRHSQTHPEKIHHLSFLEDIDDKDVLLAIQEMRRRTCQVPRKTPHTHAVIPDKISRLERVAPTEVENSNCITVQKEDVASTCSTAPSSLDPSEHPQESERSSVHSCFPGEHWVIQNATDRSSCTGSYSRMASSCHTTQPKSRKNAQINPEQPANSHSWDPNEAKGSSEIQEDKKIRFGDIIPILGIERSLQRKTQGSATAHIDASHGSTPDMVPIKEHSNGLTATLLDLAETYLDEKMNIKFYDDSTLGSTWDEDTLTLNTSLTLNEPVVEKRVAFPPAISTFLRIVACQDNDIYLYDDNEDDRNFLSLLVDDGHSVETKLSGAPAHELNSSELLETKQRTTPNQKRNSSGGRGVLYVQASSRDSSYDPSLDIGMRRIKGSENEAAADASGSTGVYRSMAESKTEHANHDMADSDDERSLFEDIEVQAVDQGDKPEILSKVLVESVWPHKIYRISKKHGDKGDGNFPPTPPITLGKLRTASPLFVKQDTKEGSAVGTFMSQPKGCTFDLTKVSSTFDDQSDADCDALADGARSERPVVENSVSQIKGITTEQPNAVGANANSFQSTKKAKAWKFDLTKTSVTFDEQNADADCQALLGDVRNEGPVNKEPVQATPTLEGADQPDNQLESECIEMMSSICDSKSFKKKGWKLKWGRREK